MPIDAVTVNRDKDTVSLTVNGQTETFDPDDAVAFLMDQCGMSYGEAVCMIGSMALNPV